MIDESDISPIVFLYPLLSMADGWWYVNQSVMVMVSSLCFGWAHLLYGNWIAPVISTAGGLLFAFRYIRSKSLITVSIEHGLWGNFLYTIGIGWYFYSGSIQP